MNAISMLAPLLYLVQDVATAFHPGVFLLLLATCAHCPLSIIFHWRCADDLTGPSHLADLRRLDQSYIHFASVLFAISVEPRWDFVLSVLGFNVVGVAMCWNAPRCLVGRHWVLVYLALMAPLLALLVFETRFRSFVTGFLAITLGGVPFLEPVNARVFRGWGHAVFHLFTALYAHALSSAVRSSAVRWPFGHFE
jgi:hypothetical protein